ncbi:TetR/AcrR family transcriptional regulator [Jatrophihabitans sp. YIM 134969]
MAAARPADDSGSTPRRGRPVSLVARRSALDAARDLLDERGYGGFTVDEVARRSGVSKATLYKHWPDGFALAVEAFGDIVTNAVPTRSTGDAPRDLRGQIVRLAAFYASPPGRVAAQLIGAAAGRPDGDSLIRTAFFGSRREATERLVEAGKAAGQLRTELATPLVVDLLFGPLVFRLFNGLGPMSAREARAVAAVAVAAVSAPA